ncbi:MAG TPA: N-6 DNA methylase [Candidatus Paceibacterota bacterium]|nr:N-6 DNA methylase [Candidatus Paceibacterota bacterium]
MRIKPYYKISPDRWLLTSNPDIATAKRKALENPKLDERQIEEYVRQWVLRELIDTYSYPVEWLGERIVVEETVQMATMEKQADISIKNERHKTFLYIETKNSGVNQMDFDKAEKQLMGYLSSTHTATVGMITCVKTTKCLVKKIDPNDFDYIPDIPTYDQKGLRQRAKLVREVTSEMIKSGRKTGLTPISDKYEDLLFRCHSAIRDIDGTHADEALDELSKIIYAKIYDERSTVDMGEGATFRFQIYGAGNTEEIASNIRDLYKEATEKDLQRYSQRIPGYERSRGVFKQQIRLSSNALVKVVEILQNYSFVDTGGDIKGRAFQKVLGPAIRAGMGQYFTPDEVVKLAVGIVRPQVSDLILDPFCGSGHFLTSALEEIKKLYEQNKIDEYSYHQFKFFHLHGIEKSERMVRIAMSDMLLQDDGHSNIRCTDALLSFDNYPDIKALGGEDNSDPQVFDVVLTNPPFGSLMGGEIGNIIGRFELGKGKKSLPLEILGLERCLQFLKPGGKLAIVLQDGVLTDTTHAHVREWLHEQGELVAVVSLPEHTFTPYGASPKTSVLFFRKNDPQKKKGKEKPVFFVKIEDIGYDATGRLKGKSEVPDVIKLFHKERGW